MATKNFYVTRDQQDPLYKHRMLKAGVAYPMRESVARWFGSHFGVELTDQAPKRAAPKAEVAPGTVHPDETIARPTTDTTPPAAKKAAPKRPRKK